jgi:ectoine hydroxylase-related dioxygenase (phytanoyl-CoA dioxygenase family)
MFDMEFVVDVSSACVEQVYQATQFHGFCIVTNALSNNELAIARASLGEILPKTPYGTTAFNGYRTRRVTGLFAKTRAFDGAVVHPLVLGVLDRLLGLHYQLSAPMAIEVGPAEVEQKLHRDQGLYPVPEDFPEIIVNTMWAIDDFTLENGATRVYPGSHRLPRLLSDAEPFRCVMPAGSLLIMSGKLWHGAGANHSCSPRLGVILEYQVAWLRPQETHLLAVSREIARKLPTKLQELLGYNVYPPVMGLVDGEHPQRFLNGDA